MQKLCLLFAPFALFAQEKFVRYDLSAGTAIRVTTDVILRGKGKAAEVVTPISSKSLAVTAFDRSTGAPLKTKPAGNRIAVDFGRTLNERAEFRLGLEEQAPREVLMRTEGTRLIFERDLENGRHLIVLPPGYTIRSCSLPAQVRVEGDRVEAGVVQAGSVPVHLRLEAEPGAVTGVPMKGAFRATDDRTVKYWLESPETHRIRLWLEIYVTKPGQSHFYSQLRPDDAIQEPVTVDMDRGVELPTRIVSGKEANALGDAPAPFPDGASVLVADLGYRVPEHGSARIRCYQLATDPKNYRTDGPDGFHLDRFIARAHSIYVLPKGWDLASVDYPAAMSRDEEGRLVLDFTMGGSESNKLVITGRRGK
jgi:hypothetical protein